MNKESNVWWENEPLLKFAEHLPNGKTFICCSFSKPSLQACEVVTSLTTGQMSYPSHKEFRWFVQNNRAALLLLLSRFGRGSPLGSAIPGILQARTLEWVAISFSNAGKWKVKVMSLSRVRLLEIPWTAAYRAPSMGFSRQEYWSGVPLPSPITELVKVKVAYIHLFSIFISLFLLCKYVLLYHFSRFHINEGGRRWEELGVDDWDWHVYTLNTIYKKEN